MKRNALALICIAVLCTILTLGLWPFHPPRNDVTWLENGNGLRFGRFSTALSSGAFEVSGAPHQESVSLEIWLQPRRIWDSNTILAFYTPENPCRFCFRQSQTGLLLQTRIADQPQRAK